MVEVRKYFFTQKLFNNSNFRERKNVIRKIIIDIFITIHYLCTQISHILIKMYGPQNMYMNQKLFVMTYFISVHFENLIGLISTCTTKMKSNIDLWEALMDFKVCRITWFLLASYFWYISTHVLEQRMTVPWGKYETASTKSITLLQENFLLFEQLFSLVCGNRLEQSYFNMWSTWEIWKLLDKLGQMSA